MDRTAIALLAALTAAPVLVFKSPAHAEMTVQQAAEEIGKLAGMASAASRLCGVGYGVNQTTVDALAVSTKALTPADIAAGGKYRAEYERGITAADKETIASAAGKPVATICAIMAGEIGPSGSNVMTTREVLIPAQTQATPTRGAQAQSDFDQKSAEGQKGMDIISGKVRIPDAPPPARKMEAVKVCGADLAVQTHRWDGCLIETKARCLYADLNEYRCMADGVTRIDFSDLTPYPVRGEIQANCDTIRKSTTSPRCLVTLQFTYESYAQMDLGGIAGHQTVIMPKNSRGEIISYSAGRKSRR